jgi:hypothetical protein
LKNSRNPQAAQVNTLPAGVDGWAAPQRGQCR